MAIEATCGSCGKRLVLSDAAADETTNCPACGLAIEPPASDPILFDPSSSRHPPVSMLDLQIDLGRPRARSKQAASTQSRRDVVAQPEPFPGDPWYYMLFWLSGILTVSASVITLAVVFLGAYVEVRGIHGDLVLYSVVGFVSGAATLFMVDVARNIRRLRLHTDRNAGMG